MKSLRLILAVARYELKMQVRAFALWVVALLLTILVWITLSTPQILQRARQNVAYSVVSNVGLAAGALLIFIIAPSLYRDYQFRFADLLWSRPVQASEYILGKFFGLITVVIFAITVPILASFAISRWMNASIDVITCFRLLIVLAVPTALFVTILCSLLTILLRRALFIYFLAIALWLAALLLQPNLLDLGNYGVQETYYSPIIGFGPDTDLLYANRLVYLSLSGTLLCMAIVLFPFIEPRSELSARCRYLLLASTIVLALGTVWSIVHFRAVAAPLASYRSRSYTETISPSTDDRPNTVHRSPIIIDDYELILTIEPFKGELSGQAEIHFTNLSSDPILSIRLGLNKGLKVDTAMAAETPLKFQQRDILLFDPPLAPGVSQKLRVQYSGRLQFARSDYQIDGLPQDEPREIRGYIGQGSVFLLRDGEWYPFSTLDAPQQLEITLPSRLPVVTTANRNIQRDGQRTLVWEHGDLLPIPLLAGSEAYVQTRLQSQDIAYLPSGYNKRMIDEITLPFVHGAKYLDRWLLNVGRAVTSAVVPLITAAAYDPQQGILFLPEGTFRRYAFTTKGNALSFQQMYTRWVAEEMAKAWWRGNHIALETGSHDQRESGLASSIASYSAMLIADDLLNGGFADQELAARRKSLTAMREGTPLFHNYLMASLVPDNAFLSVHELRTELGDESFRQLMQGYLEEWRGEPSSITVEEFADLVRRKSGYDITPMLNKYGMN